MYEPNPSKMDIKVLIPASTQQLILQTKDQMFSHKKKVLKKSLDKMKQYKEFMVSR